MDSVRLPWSFGVSYLFRRVSIPFHCVLSSNKLHSSLSFHTKAKSLLTIVSFWPKNVLPIANLCSESLPVSSLSPIKPWWPFRTLCTPCNPPVTHSTPFNMDVSFASSVGLPSCTLVQTNSAALVCLLLSAVHLCIRLSLHVRWFLVDMCNNKPLVTPPRYVVPPNSPLDSLHSGNGL